MFGINETDMRNSNKLLLPLLINLAVGLFLLIGYVKCVIKVIDCNWNPIGKAEIIYTAGIFTGLGGIIGWIEIEDK